jgi:hypothetical protein
MRKPARQPLDYVRKADTARPQSDGWSGATRQGGRESIQVVAGSRSHKPPSGRLGLMQVCSLLTCPDNERPRSKLRGIEEECHAREACPREGGERASRNLSWIPSFEGMTNSKQASGNSPEVIKMEIKWRRNDEAPGPEIGYRTNGLSPIP